jgi:hypothetical protein
MFERLGERARRIAEPGAARAARRIADDAAGEAPPGVRVEQVDGGVRLSGRDLRQRMLREPALRWLIGRVR